MKQIEIDMLCYEKALYLNMVGRQQHETRQKENKMTERKNIDELKTKYEELGKEIERLEGTKKTFKQGEDYYKLNWGFNSEAVVTRAQVDLCETQHFPRQINMFHTEEEAHRCVGEVNSVLRRYEARSLGKSADKPDEVEIGSTSVSVDYEDDLEIEGEYIKARHRRQFLNYVTAWVDYCDAKEGN